MNKLPIRRCSLCGERRKEKMGNVETGGVRLSVPPRSVIFFRPDTDEPLVICRDCFKAGRFEGFEDDEIATCQEAFSRAEKDSKLFGERIGKYKYAKWAKDLTEDQLEALLWAVGEFGHRAYEPFIALRQYSPQDPFAYGRALAGLQAIVDFSRERPMSLEQLLGKVRKTVQDTRQALNKEHQPAMKARKRRSE